MVFEGQTFSPSNYTKSRTRLRVNYNYRILTVALFPGKRKARRVDTRGD